MLKNRKGIAKKLGYGLIVLGLVQKLGFKGMHEKLKPKIVVTRKIPTAVSDLLRANFNVELNETDVPFSKKQLQSAVKRADGILCTVSDQIDSEVIKVKNSRISIISNFGVGVSNIDIACAENESLVVTNTPNVLTESTAEIALFLILAVSRKTTLSEDKLRRNLWKGFSIVDDLGISLSGKTLGIVGMGRIGKATARKVKNALNMEIIFHNRSRVTDKDAYGRQVETLDELLTKSDIISIHAPGGGDVPILTEKDILKMKPSAFLINTARGDVIDEKGLIKALKANQIGGAGLDVFESEPNVPEELLSLPNVTLLPHIGSATLQTREAMGFLAVNNLIAHFSDKNYPSRVI